MDNAIGRRIVQRLPLDFEKAFAAMDPVTGHRLFETPIRQKDGRLSFSSGCGTLEIEFETDDDDF